MTLKPLVRTIGVAARSADLGVVQLPTSTSLKNPSTSNKQLPLDTLVLLRPARGEGRGDGVGDDVGDDVAALVCDCVGDSVGDGVVADVGATVGDCVSDCVGDGVGDDVAALVCDCVGDCVGDGVVADVGATVASATASAMASRLRLDLWRCLLKLLRGLSVISERVAAVSMPFEILKPGCMLRRVSEMSASSLSS